MNPPTQALQVKIRKDGGSVKTRRFCHVADFFSAGKVSQIRHMSPHVICCGFHDILNARDDPVSETVLHRCASRSGCRRGTERARSEPGHLDPRTHEAISESPLRCLLHVVGSARPDRGTSSFPLKYSAISIQVAGFELPAPFTHDAQKSIPVVVHTISPTKCVHFSCAQIKDAMQWRPVKGDSHDATDPHHYGRCH